MAKGAACASRFPVGSRLDAQGGQRAAFGRYTVGVNAAVATPPPPRNRLERFRAIRARLDPSGDPGALLDAYVEPHQAVSRRVAAELELAPASAHLIVGGIGSGKTTELLMTKRRLLELDDVMTVYVDVSKRHDIAKMVPGVLLAQVTLAIADGVAAIDPTNPHVRDARDVAHGKWRGLDEFDIHGDDSHLMKFVPGVLQPLHPLTEDVERAKAPLEGLLILARQRARHLVVLLDGLDRMSDLAMLENLVVQDVKVLSALGIGVVLVGPLRALYGLDRLIVQRFDSFHPVPWIDVTGNPAGRAFLVDVLTRRAGDALDLPGIEALVDASGGVLRDLLALAQSALVEVYMSGHDRIGSHDVDDAVDAFGRKHLQGLRPAEIEVLQRVRTQAAFVETSEDDLALLMTRRVLAYGSGDRSRYAVHPTISHLLVQLAGA